MSLTDLFNRLVELGFKNETYRFTQIMTLIEETEAGVWEKARETCAVGDLERFKQLADLLTEIKSIKGGGLAVDCMTETQSTTKAGITEQSHTLKENATYTIPYKFTFLGNSYSLSNNTWVEVCSSVLSLLYGRDKEKFKTYIEGIKKKNYAHLQVSCSYKGGYTRIGKTNYYIKFGGHADQLTSFLRSTLEAFGLAEDSVMVYWTKNEKERKPRSKGDA